MSRIDASARDLSTVREILRKHVPTRQVIAFGSRATGHWATTARSFRDIIARDAVTLQEGSTETGAA